MTKKQNYTAPEMLSLDFYPKESVLNFASEASLSSALTLSASTQILGGTEADGGVEW